MYSMELDNQKLINERLPAKDQTDVQVENRLEQNMKDEKQCDKKFDSRRSKSKTSISRNVWMDQKLHKRGIFVNAITIEDLIKRLKNAEPGKVIKKSKPKPMCGKCYLKKMWKKLEREALHKKDGRHHKNERRMLRKLSDKAKTNQPQIDEKLNTLLEKLQINM